MIDQSVFGDRNRLDSLQRLSEISNRSHNEIMDFALEEAIHLTHSEIGYIYHYNEDQKLLILYAWSEKAMQQCAITKKQTTYHLDDTGLWGEAIRQRKAIITNDYAASGQYKRGYPEGHIELIRHMNLPIFRQDRIVAVVGVGNSSVAYTEDDVHQLRLFMDTLWNIAGRKKLEEELKANEIKFRTVADFTYDWEYWASPEGTIIYCSPACQRITGYSPMEINQNPKLTREIIHPDDLTKYLEHYSQAYNPVGRLESEEMEYRIISRDGTVKWIGHACQPVFNQEQEFLGRRISNRDITNRKTFELHLVQSNAEIKNLNERVMQMLSIMSHDIRSPLISLSATLRLLQRGRFGRMDDSVMNTINDLVIRTQRILGVADDCLGKSSSMESIVNLQKKEIDLRQEVIDGVLEELSDQIEQEDINIDNRLGAIPGGTILVKASAMWLKVVYRNLFGNAIKYGGKGCTLAFGYQNRPDHYRLNVYNSGTPIPREKEPLLFTRFGRVNPESDDDHDSVGMGLFLVKEVITQHGGKIWHESTPDGNDFVFTLPKD